MVIISKPHITPVDKIVLEYVYKISLAAFS